MASLKRQYMRQSKNQKWLQLQHNKTFIYWLREKATFDVDPNSEKDVLSSIASCVRTFRKTLTRYVYEHKSDPSSLSKPPAIYHFLLEKEWHSFVERRATKEFEEYGAKQRKRRKCNKYDHRLSRKGYMGLQEEMAKKCGKPVVSVDRSVSWKMARQNKDEGYDNIDIEEKAAEIDELTKQVEDGTLQTQGRNDILTIALGGTEHGGRVRAVGGKVTPTLYFNVPRRGNHSRCEEKQKSLEKSLAENEEKRQSLEKVVSHMKVQLDAIQQCTPHTPHSDNVGSNTFRSHNIRSPQVNPSALEDWGRTNDDTSPPNPTPNAKKGKKCKLAVGSLNNVVADGTVYKSSGPNERIHTVPLGEGNLRVLIDSVKVGHANLPIPIPEVAATVEEALGCFVAWPKSHILFAPESKQCRLALGSVDNIVAYGTMYWKSGPNELLHTVPLGDSNMRVSIDVVKVKEALLPVPISKDVTTVGDAIGCQVGSKRLTKVAPKIPTMVGNERNFSCFPHNMEIIMYFFHINFELLDTKCLALVALKKHVIIGNERAVKQGGVAGRRGVIGSNEATSKNVEWEKNLECIKMYSELVKHVQEGAGYTIPLDKDLFGVEVDVNLQKVDMEAICHMKWLTGTCIMLYMRLLYFNIKASNMDTRFAFFNPCGLSEHYKDGDISKSGMLARRLEDVKNNQLLLVPLNTGTHWVFCIIELSSSTVYYMDSVSTQFNPPLQILITT
ncbi:hypothetical protein RHMOL_Rhmol13G0074100 [Rhododendron molle]|uniref:Uncharacterized protein n=1 Tax=Rhododendron molle TaxID=49168 RepID=A0ACC0L497_RHOML|nr:hypothetical protein RHMOL_Rhmol13G0074100 [Rhododendron molle]